MRAALPLESASGRPAAPLGERAGWAVTLLVVLAAGALLLSDGLAFILRQWSDPEFSHGWLIPLVTGFVLWSRRGLIAEARGRGAWAGTAVVLLALTIILLAKIAFVLRGPYVGLVLLLLGLGLAGLGWRAMRFALLPILFLLFAFPLPGSVAVPLATTLQLVSSKLGAAILGGLGVSMVLEGNIIDLGDYKLQVAEACSGLRYLFPLASFGFLCAWLFRAPLWGRALVLVSILPITVVTNSARIALTGLLFDQGYPELADGAMHLVEGWMIFLVALAVLFVEMLVIARLTGGRGGVLGLLDFDRLDGRKPLLEIGRGADARSAAAEGIAAAPRRVPAPLVACAGLMLATALAYAPLTAREQTIPDRPGLVTLPLRLEGWVGRAQTVDDAATLKALGASDHLLADFVEAGQRPAGAAVNLWIAYYGQQLAGAAIHSPKDCLPGGGWEYAELATIDAPVTTADGRTFQVVRGVIAKGLDQMVIWYWLEMRGRQLTADSTLKLYNLWDSFRLGRSDGALIRLMSPVLEGETTADADRRLGGLMRRLYPALDPHVGA